MPKRNSKHLEEYIDKKFKELENKLSRKRRRLPSSSSSSSSTSTSRSSSPASVVHRSDSTDRNQDEATTPALMDDNIQLETEPAATPISEPVAGTSTSANQLEEAEAESPLDAQILEILGVDPTNPIKYSQGIQKDLAIRLEHGVTQGLQNPDRKTLLDKYLIPDNCQFIGAPSLNPELKGALSEFMLKRDKVMEAQQKITAAAIASLGQTISSLLSSKDKNTELLSSLMDTARLLCDRQHADSKTRRLFIINAVKKDMRESLENSKIDNFLFGQNLCDLLKTAKAVNKTSSDLVVKTLKTAPANKTNPKNWKGSHAARKPHATANQKTKETPASTKNQRSSSSKRSPSRRQHRGRR